MSDATHFASPSLSPHKQSSMYEFSLSVGVRFGVVCLVMLLAGLFVLGSPFCFGFEDQSRISTSKGQRLCHFQYHTSNNIISTTFAHTRNPYSCALLSLLVFFLLLACVVVFHFSLFLLSSPPLRSCLPTLCLSFALPPTVPLSFFLLFLSFLFSFFSFLLSIFAFRALAFRPKVWFIFLNTQTN